MLQCTGEYSPGQSWSCPGEYSPGQSWSAFGISGQLTEGAEEEVHGIAPQEEAAEKEFQSIAREHEPLFQELPHLVRSCLGGTGNSKKPFCQTGGKPFRPWGSSPRELTHNAPTIVEPTNMFALCLHLAFGGMRASPSPAPTRRNASLGRLHLCIG